MARDQLQATPQLRAKYALHKARQYRHHRDCFCRMFDKQFCNAADALWQNKLNHELDKIKGGVPPCGSHS
jgi:hypothetical protein